MSFRLASQVWEEVGLPPGPKLVLMALADQADDLGGCYPGRRRLAQKCGIGIRTLDAHLQVLITKGLVAKVKRKRQDGSYTSSLYQLWPEGRGGSADSAQGGAKSTQGGAKSTQGGAKSARQEPTTYPTRDPAREPPPPRARVEGGTGGGGSCPSDFNSKIDIDDYLELGLRWGGKAGSPPTNPTGWARTVGQRLLDAGLTSVDMTQLATWRQRRDIAAAREAEAKAEEEARAATAVAKALAEEEDRRLDRIYDALPAGERQIIDEDVSARIIGRCPPGTSDIGQQFALCGQRDKTRREVVRERELVATDPEANSADARAQEYTAQAAMALAAPWPCRPRRPADEPSPSREARERAQREKLQAQAKEMGIV